MSEASRRAAEARAALERCSHECASKDAALVALTAIARALEGERAKLLDTLMGRDGDTNADVLARVRKLAGVTSGGQSETLRAPGEKS